MKSLARWLLVLTLSTMLVLVVALVLLQSHFPIGGERGEWVYGVLVVTTFEGARVLIVLVCLTVAVFAWRWWRARRRRAAE